MNIALQEIICPICHEGVYNNQMCPICLGHSVLFRIKGNTPYIIGSEIIAVNYKFRKDSQRKEE